MEPVSAFLAAIRPFLDVGATGLLVVVMFMILTGRLVTRSTLEFYIDAYNKSQAALAQKDTVIADLADAGRVSARVLDSLPPAGGDPNVDETSTETRRRRRQG